MGNFLIRLMISVEVDSEHVMVAWVLLSHSFGGKLSRDGLQMGIIY